MTFSWHYLDLICRDGLKLVIVFYGHPFFLSFDISLLDISIYKNGKKFHYGFAVPLEKYYLQKKPLKVEIGRNRLVQTEYGYRIDINEYNIKLNLDITADFGSWTAQQIPLYEANNQYFYWEILAPVIKADGVLKTEKLHSKINGEGYLDSNEGNFLLNKKLKSWTWGRLHSVNSSIIFGSLVFNDSTIYQPIFLLNEREFSFKESKVPINLNTKKFRFFKDKLNNDFQLREKEKFDNVSFLISKLPIKWKFLRKVHEFLFYRLDEKKWGRKINYIFANVDYERYWIELADLEQEKFTGILESMEFK